MPGAGEQSCNSKNICFVPKKYGLEDMQLNMGFFALWESALRIMIHKYVASLS